MTADRERLIAYITEIYVLSLLLGSTIVNLLFKSEESF